MTSFESLETVAMQGYFIYEEFKVFVFNTNLVFLAFCTILTSKVLKKVSTTNSLSPGYPSIFTILSVGGETTAEITFVFSCFGGHDGFL